MVQLPVSFLLLLCITFSVATPPPQLVRWSSNSYGPDGPWQAITLTIGTPPQTVDLLPGGSWMSNVLAPSICTGNAPCNIAKSAGFYDPSVSSSTFQIAQTGFVNNISMFDTVGAIPSLQGSANWMFDTVFISLGNGTAGNEYKQRLLDFDLLVLSDAHQTLPDGTTYPVQVGKLALGAPNFNQTWLHFPPQPNWNGTLLPSSLFGMGGSPSNSYGMHVGSTQLGIPGSLTLGGYDQSRVLGVVSSQSYNIDHLPIDLLDIGIGVAEGQSPFDFTSKSGLLAEGNSSIGIALSIYVEAPVSYLHLPQSTCDAITKYLPVTYKPNLGLYLWDTDDPMYELIVSSPSYLSFTFRLSNSVSQNMTINVPFSLLNMTLTSPIVSSPVPYLPISPGHAPSDNFALGRAFMQAAFVGVNWQTGNGVWFLGQAPGPNTPSDTPALTIVPNDNVILGSTTQWRDTWKGVWKVIDTPASPTAEVPTSSKTSTRSLLPTEDQGLSKGTIIGIAVGAGLGILLACVAGFFLLRRRKARRQQSLQVPQQFAPQDYRAEGYAPHNSLPSQREKYGSTIYTPREMDAGFTAKRPVEMEG
ncbi:aspartic-type endopeptidase [Phlyctema vagabunda]|uniref:Aspartic-type endopeptidase n=1 Tax=Phlyctema vagabunda TaxID=108571 RepID=A0ABR4PI15_9HELO